MPVVTHELSALEPGRLRAGRRRHPRAGARTTKRPTPRNSSILARLAPPEAPGAESSSRMRLARLLRTISQLRTHPAGRRTQLRPRRSDRTRRRQMVRLAPAGRRRPAAQHRIRRRRRCALPTATPSRSPRAAPGHGYVGGCVPVRGGIVLSLARMNRIKEINAADFVAVVQPGVNTAELAGRQSRSRGCSIRPIPPAARTSMIGGNIVTNAGGPRCLKYGVTRDYVLGLEVVLADGTHPPPGRPHAQEQDRLRAAPALRRLGGPAGRRHRSHAEAAAAAAVPRLPGRRVRLHARGRPLACTPSSPPAFCPPRSNWPTPSPWPPPTNAPAASACAGCRAHLIVELDGQTRLRAR